MMKDKNRQHYYKHKHQREDLSLVTAPINEQLSPRKRLESSLELSDLVTTMVTTYGALRGIHSGIVQSEVIMDDLFR